MEESHESHGRVPSSRLSGDELLSIRSVWISKKKVRVSVEEASGVLEETEYQIRRRYQSKKAFCYLPQSRHAIRAFLFEVPPSFLLPPPGWSARSRRGKRAISVCCVNGRRWSLGFPIIPRTLVGICITESSLIRKVRRWTNSVVRIPKDAHTYKSQIVIRRYRILFQFARSFALVTKAFYSSNFDSHTNNNSSFSPSFSSSRTMD